MKQTTIFLLGAFLIGMAVSVLLGREEDRAWLQSIAARASERTVFINTYSGTVGGWSLPAKKANVCLREYSTLAENRLE